MRSIPVNIDDLPVGNGAGSNSEYIPKGSGNSYDNESNAESRFASSSNKNIHSRKSSSPRAAGKGDYHDDNDMSSPAHGQNSEVAYMTGDKVAADQTKSRITKGKDNGSYDIKDSFSGNNDAHRYMMIIFQYRNFKYVYISARLKQLLYESYFFYYNGFTVELIIKINLYFFTCNTIIGTMTMRILDQIISLREITLWKVFLIFMIYQPQRD